MRTNKDNKTTDAKNKEENTKMVNLPRDAKEACDAADKTTAQRNVSSKMSPKDATIPWQEIHKDI